MELGLDGLPRMTAKELAAYLALTGEERRKFDAARTRRMEVMEREEWIESVVARLSRTHLPITSVKNGIVTIDLNRAWRERADEAEEEKGRRVVRRPRRYFPLER
jgi:hypothetical protein